MHYWANLFIFIFYMELVLTLIKILVRKLGSLN